MSLLVWLPLNGNFTNNGIAYFEDFELPSNASWSAGKLGNNLNISNASTRRTITKLNNLKEFSISLWYKMKTDTTYTQWKDVIMVTDSISEFRLETSNTAGTAMCWYGYGMNNSGTGNVSTTLGVWYHDTVVVSGKTIKRYVNGNLQSTTTAVNDCQLAGDLRLGDTGMYCQIADVRIYDHCLSKREVKEISKGLVLHYQLNETFAIDNIMRNATYGTYNNFTNVGATGSVAATGETYNGCAVYRLTFTPTADCLNHVQTTLHGHGIMGFRTTFLANTKYCFWILYKPISHSDTICGGTASNIGGFIEISPAKWSDNWMVVGQYRNGTVTSDKTDNIFVSFKTPSATAGTPITIDFCCPHLIVGYDSIQPEYDYAGTNPTTIYDSSGYQNNGIKVGTLESNNNTPRNTSSLIFGASKGIYCTPTPAQRSDGQELTVSCWFKQTDRTNYQYLVCNRDSSYYNWMLYTHTTDGSIQFHGKEQYKSSVIPTLNVWHHVVAVVYTNQTYSLFLDGIKVVNAITYLYQTQTSTNLCIGKFGTTTTCSQPFIGQISDVRIYATALSDADIFELYNAPINFNKHSLMSQGEFLEK